MSSAQEHPVHGGRVSPWRRTAAIGLAVEALALAAGGLLAIGVVLVGSADSVAVLLSLAGFALLVATLLGFATVAVQRGRERVRGPVLTLQLLQAASAGTFIGGAGDATPVGIRIAFWFAALLAVVVVAAVVIDAARREH